MSAWFHALRRASGTSVLSIAILIGGIGQFVAAPAIAAVESYGPVTSSETLWSIARKFTKGRGTTAQVAWALYRANPKAFEGSIQKIRPGSTLTVPDAALVREVAPEKAYAALTGHAPPAKPVAATAAKPVVVAAVEPAPAPSAAPAAPVATAGSAGPLAIAGLELQPKMGAEVRQWLAVIGSGFQPGAVLEFRDVGRGLSFPARKPASVTPSRIEYQLALGAQTSRWQVVVRNPDGKASRPYDFDGGADVTLTYTPPQVAPPAQAVTAAPGSSLGPLAAPVATVGFNGSADQAKAMQMLQAGGDADAVYKFLAPLEQTYGGDVDFDYRLGTEAFDSGRFGEAIFALQRAIATRPKFSGARMELARAYYGQGDNESARREFVTLQDENPPPEAKRVIADYLAAIDRHAAVYESQLGAWVNLDSGYDSNANGAPDTQTFLGFTLDSRNQSTSSAYYALGLGGNGSYPFAPQWRLLGNAGASYRTNPDASFVDSQLGQVSGGLEWRPGPWTFTAMPGYVYAMLNGKENHQALGVDTTAAYGFTASQVSLNLHYGQQRFADVLSIEDTNTLIYGLAGQVNLPVAVPLQAGVALTAGKDDAVQSLAPYGRTIKGGRVFLTTQLPGSHAFTASVAKLDSDYDGQFFGQSRTDNQLNGTLGYEWGALRGIGWTIGAHVSYVNNASTILLYDYKRYDAGLSVRKDFR